jgi:hypothetical protein
MEKENVRGKIELSEKCCICGKILKPDKGRFRKQAAVYCIECYKRLNSSVSEEYSI